MNIAFVAHNFVRGNGQGRINLETARYAARNQHRVTLLADQVDEELLREPNIDWDEIHQRPRRPNLVGGWRFAAAADRRLRQRRGDFDIVVGTGYSLTEPHDVNLCQFVHHAWLHSPVHVAKLSRGPWSWYQWYYTRANVRFERQAYAVAGVVVAPSEKIRAELVSAGVPHGRTRVIYNGVDPVEFQPKATADVDARERAELGLPSPDLGPLALFAGDIRTPRKNLDSVLKALRDVPSLRLAVVGAVANSPFPKMAQQLGVADRVTFMDFRRDISRVMRSADFFVFPSRYEAGTLVLTEAAASGLPLVTAATAGGAEVFGPDVARTLTDPDDVTALAAAMRHFANNPDARRAASLAARAAAERLTWADMSQRYLDLFIAATEKRLARSPSISTLVPEAV